MAGYLGTKAVLLSTTAADVIGNAEIGGSLNVGGNLTSTGIDDNASSTAITIDSSQNVGIGTSSPSESLTNRGNIFIETNSTSADSGNGLFWQSTTTGWSTSTAHAAIYGKRTDASNGYLRFDTRQSGTTEEAMRIDSNGHLLVGKTGAGTIVVSGMELSPNYAMFAGNNASNPSVFIGANGSSGNLVSWYYTSTLVGTVTTNGSSTSYNTSSDYRLKTDAQPMTGASARVQALKPVNFEWLSDGTRVDGFLAHEAQEVVPEAVTGTKDAMRDEEYEVTPAVLDDDGNVVTEAVMGTRSVPDYQGIDQSKLVPLLTAALQEALTKIDDMETRLAALEAM